MPGEVNTEDPPEPHEELDNLAASDISTVLESVPEHQGGISSLIERYGDDPTKCPFLNSMGAKGMELYQRIKEDESRPDRGPTMRELLEAKRQESEKSIERQVEEVDIAEEAKQVLETSKPPAMEVNEAPVVEVVKPITTEEDELLQEREILLRSIFENEPLPAPLVVNTETIPVKVGASFEQDVFTTDEGRVEEGTKETVPVMTSLDAVIESRPYQDVATVSTAEEIVETGVAVPPLPIIKIKPDVFPVPSLIAESEPVIIASLPAPASPKEKQKPFRAETGVDAIIHSVDSDSIFTALAEAMPELPFEQDEVLLMPSLIEEASLEIGILEPPHDHETPIEASLFYPLEEVSSQEDVHYFETNEADVLTPVSLQEKILSFVEQLDESEAEEPQGYLNELIEIMNLVSASTELKPETEEELVLSIEEALVKLFESIKLELDEKTIASIARSLIANRPTLPKQQSHYSIEQLNILGTREYKTDSFKSSFLSIFQSLKNNINAKLSIGRYALKASF